MTDSAPSGVSRRAETTRRILDCAHSLCLERGFSGFTLDDLAEVAGVSRRTLFNHVGDKDHAVFGPPLELAEADIADFRAGGPTGDLLQDLLTLMHRTLGERPDLARQYNQVTVLLCAHPDLAQRFLACLETGLRAIAEHIVARPGETPDRAELALTALFGIFRQAARHAVDDDDVTFTSALQRSGATFLALARSGGQGPAHDFLETEH